MTTVSQSNEQETRATLERLAPFIAQMVRLDPLPSPEPGEFPTVRSLTPKMRSDHR